jgi:hypothetical protein
MPDIDATDATATEPKWEPVIKRSHDSFDSVRRLPVPGGWLYEVRSQGTGAENLVFVPQISTLKSEWIRDGVRYQRDDHGVVSVVDSNGFCVGCAHHHRDHLDGFSCTHLTDRSDGTATVCACAVFLHGKPR